MCFWWAKVIEEVIEQEMELRIGLFGAGVVGGGVVELLQRDSVIKQLSHRGASIKVVKICVRDLEKPRDFSIPADCIITASIDEVLEDPSINCIVELIGGVTRYGS